jgi:hypothetical protein
VGKRRLRHLVLGLLTPSWVVAAALAPAAATAGDRVVFRLPRPLQLQNRVAFSYPLPEGARQGPRDWYTIRLHYRLTFAPDSSAGHAWVMADTNRRTCAQVEYTLVRGQRGLRYRRTTVDLEHGQLERRSTSTRDDVRFANYLQEAGVKGGSNELSIRVERTRGVKLRRLQILGVSVVRTARTPYPFQLRPSLITGDVGAGERFRVAVELRNVGGTPLHGVVVREQHDSRRLERLSGPTVRHGPLWETGRVVFDFRARREGRHRITFLGDSDRNHPIAVVEVRVGGRRGGRTTTVVVVAALAALLGGLAIALSRRTG